MDHSIRNAEAICKSASLQLRSKHIEKLSAEYLYKRFAHSHWKSWIHSIIKADLPRPCLEEGKRALNHWSFNHTHAKQSPMISTRARMHHHSCGNHLLITLFCAYFINQQGDFCNLVFSLRFPECKVRPPDITRQSKLVSCEAVFRNKVHPRLWLCHECFEDLNTQNWSRDLAQQISYESLCCGRPSQSTY